MVRLEGLREGSRGDRNGEAGADVGSAGFFVVPGGTLRLKFLALRGRFGGEGDRCEEFEEFSL